MHDAKKGSVVTRETKPRTTPTATGEKRKRSERRQRTAGILVRVTGEEKAEIDARAQAAGLTAGGFLRAAGLGGKTPRSLPRTPIDRELLAEAVAELNRVGNNLNQIARALNRDERMPPQIIRTALEQYSHAYVVLVNAAQGGAA